jgi:hypothetical protein
MSSVFQQQLPTESMCPSGERCIRQTLIRVESAGHGGSAERGDHQTPEKGNGANGGA